jgi:enterochelin esterase-like enzyme
MKNVHCISLVIVFILISCNNFLFGQYLTEVDSDGRATVKAIVPNANTVRFRGLPGSWGLNSINLGLTNSGNDLWQVTTSPIATGFHYYRMEINGILTVNPNERVYYCSNAWNSGLEIPNDTIDFYNIKDVPHGTIVSQLYNSTITQSVRQCFIYLPPNYNANSADKYPVLFLQHGNGENQYGWHMQGKLNLILDNLIAEGKAVPMVVVMDNGMTFLDNYVELAYLIINDLIPLVEEKYNVKQDKKFRAVAGLSMGAGQAIVAGLFFPEFFSYVGDFSGSIDPYNWTEYTQTVNLNDSLELLWLGCGTSDEYYSYFNRFEGELTAAGINHVKKLFSGAHQWQVWRKCIYEFAPLLFKPFEYHPISSVHDNLKNANELRVYPNPFNEYLHIEITGSESSELKYELFDITGKSLILYSGNKTEAESRISEILRKSAGNMFVLSVTNRQSVSRIKIINN